MTTRAKPKTAPLIDADIKATESAYTPGLAAAVRARLVYRGTEAQAMAAAFRIAADLVDATPASARWCFPEVNLEGSSRDTAQVQVRIELATGSEDERDQAIEFFHDVIPAPSA